MKQLLQTAITAAVDAGLEILKIYQQEDFDVEKKEDDSPLTRADTASHKIIFEYLRNSSIPVLSEEGRHQPYEDRKNWSKLWIVDPLDGTKEFIKRNGEFTVNIALVEDQKPVLGVIYVPVLKELYFAAEGMGAFKAENITEKLSLEELIKKSLWLPFNRKNRPFTIVASKSHLSPETEEYIEKLKKEHAEVEIISKGSSLKLCMVAEGKADYYPRFGPTMEWDTAAGQAICTCAGKKVTDLKTKKEMLYNREELKNNWFICGVKN